MRVLLTAVVLSLLSGCGGPDQAALLVGARYEISDVDYVGVQRFEPDALTAFLAMGETGWFGEPYYYMAGALPAESKRIEAAYAAVGYYDARVVDVRVVLDEDDDEAQITFVVDEGRPTRITHVEWRWRQADTVASDARVAVERLSRLEKGATFEVDALNQTVADARLALRQRGHPYATVVEHPRIDRETRTAEVVLDVTPGPYARIGEVEITGLVDVPESAVRNEVDYAPGRPFAPSLLDRMEGSVYALDVFRSVVVTPGDALDAEGRLDLKVQVDESLPQSVRLGGGVLFESNRWEQVATGRYSHHNLFGELTRLDLDLRVGYAELPNPIILQTHGVVGTSRVALKRRGLFEKRLVWTLSVKTELDLDEGYRYWAAEPALHVSRFFTRRLKISLGYRLRYLDFFDVDLDVSSPDATEFIQFVDPYVLSTIEAKAAIYLTDRILEPRNGLVLDLDYELAGGVVGGNFDYQKFTPTARLYWTPHSRLQFAARARVGLIFPYGRTGDFETPTDQRLYLGGSNSLRGWGIDALSPQIAEACFDEIDGEVVFDANAQCNGVPYGGHTLVLGNFETRVRAVGDLWVAGFVDGGDVRAFSLDLAPDEWNYSGGAGLRYASPVGFIRFDLAFRLNDPPRFVHEPDWNVHLALGDAY